jgi:hypothetical protein
MSIGGHASDVLSDTGATVYQINPLEDPRWRSLLQRHPRASLFHSDEWLEALRRTYGFQPVVFTTSSQKEELLNGLLFCSVNSWLTGKRLVSVPFSDHCDPLVAGQADLDVLAEDLCIELRSKKIRYVEMRPLRQLKVKSPHVSSSAYCVHQLDLNPELSSLFRNFHKDSVQRKILRADREKLDYQDGQSPALFKSFWDLYLLTRRRHQVPPQPKLWFRNLIDSFGQALKIRVAERNGQPVAAILTIQFKDTLVYKYGCSDTRFNNLGGTQLLFWRSIQEAKENGLRCFDLGRSDYSNPGLITFKDRWGAQRSELVYSRLVDPSHLEGGYKDGSRRATSRAALRVISYLPDQLFAIAGELLYKHIA